MQLNIFACGFLDSISVHKTLPLLVKYRDVAWLTFKIFGSNALLLVGSVTLYNEAILPGLEHLKKSIIVNDSGQENEYGLSSIQRTRILFYCFFVIPLYLMCYSCSVIWYQNLADGMHKIKKVTTTTPLAKAFVNGTYSSVAWICLFVQVQLLGTVIPLLLTKLLPYMVAPTSSISQKDSGNSEINSLWSISELQYSLVTLVICGSRAVSQGMGLFLLSIMYGWYGFDPHWIAANIDPDTRFGIIEKRWAYFLGFGAPYVVLIKFTSFFVGYGWFLALFPFCIMLGGTSDYTKPYSTVGHQLPSLRIFKTAQSWTLVVLKLVGNTSSVGLSQKGKKLV